MTIANARWLFLANLLEEIGRLGIVAVLSRPIEQALDFSTVACGTTVEKRDSKKIHATARIIAALMELDVRKLYLGEGCSSLFTYCTQVLHLSEHAAYGRIEAARAARRVPAIHDCLTEGSLTLTAVGLLAAHLTPENHVDVLAAARHKSKRDVEHLVAALHPLPAVPSSVRKLPAATPIERTAALLGGCR